MNEEYAIEADTKRPYKMYAAMLSAFVGSLLLSDAPMPIWVKAMLAAFGAALAVYLTPNPLKPRAYYKGKRRASKTYGEEDAPLF